MGTSVRSAAVPAPARPRCALRESRDGGDGAFGGGDGDVCCVGGARARDSAVRREEEQPSKSTHSMQCDSHNKQTTKTGTNRGKSAELLQRLQSAGAYWSEFIPDDAWLVVAPEGFETSAVVAPGSGHSAVRERERDGERARRV